MKEILRIVAKKYVLKTHTLEDLPVLKFLNKHVNSERLSFLEVGSGSCRFLEVLTARFPDLLVKGLEKSSDLAEFGKRKGFSVVCGSVEKLPYLDESFDFVHCSHVLEHLSYPEVTFALDEMMRVIRIGGYLIIRSPLLYPGFYFDIDHTRPYPPEAILNYFNNFQQQKVGNYDVAEIMRWYRREPVVFYDSKGILKKIWNAFSRFLWLLCGFPRARANGFILILQKL